MPPDPTPQSNCTRRRILGWGGAGVFGGLACYLGWPKKSEKAAASASPVSARPAGQKLDSTMEPAASTAASRPASREDFLPLLKSEFQLDSNTSCKLVEVGALKKMTSPTAEYTSFSLLFTASKDLVLESSLHQLTHPKMDPMELFISPIGHSEEKVFLEVVFSQKV